MANCIKNVLVIGDSHSLIWDYIDKRGLIPRYRFIVKHVHGATSQGINNPNSKTDALNIFERAINEYFEDCEYIMISLGEIDCGFAIWYYSDQFGISVDAQLERSLTAYKEFLTNKILQKFKAEQVIIMTSVLPTIEDQTRKEFLNGARSKIKTSIRDRTQLTLRYNQELRNIAQDCNVHCLDITPDILDERTNKIKNKFKNKNIYDHHLNAEASSSVYVAHFNKLLLP